MTIKAEDNVKCLILGRDYLMNILGDNVNLFIIGILNNFFKYSKMGSTKKSSFQ